MKDLHMAPGKKKVCVLTGNEHKAEEYRRIFGRYAVRPTFLAPDSEDDAAIEKIATDLLASGVDVVIRETSHLVGADGRRLRDMSLLRPATNVCKADVWTAECVTSLAETVAGYVDPHRNDTSHGFSWDRCFVPLSTNLTYGEMAARGLKTSARDLVMGRVIEDLLHFPKLVSTNFLPAGPTRLVDFETMPVDMLERLPWFQAPEFEASPASRFLGSALQDGVFFRSSASRRERNYWFPGLNGGVPFTPKKDDVHEVTFMVHDVMHTLMPDLVFDGSESEGHRRIYIMHRMLGEAASLVLADYVFVDTMVKSGVEYDFAKRRIHPLFASIVEASELDISIPEDMKRLLECSVRFAVLGDDNLMREMGADPEALDAFKEKYERFFVEDYRWTDRNFANMQKEAPLFESWTDKVYDLLYYANVSTLGSFRSSCVGNGLENGLLSECRTYQKAHEKIATMAPEDLCTLVFESCWDQFFKPAMERNVTMSNGLMNRNAARSNGFLRYMAGQSIMYERYEHVAGMSGLGGSLLREIGSMVAHPNEGEVPFSLKDIQRLRSFHEMLVDHLHRSHAISAEEARLFREVVPVFEPFFVFYDSKAEHQPTLKETVANILGGDDEPRLAAAQRMKP